ncbi:hypothetical protein THIOM_005354 [Candidatus Thiomargarita nelsonii]|uniref:Uncharacterized protein n=1 Tax=Candidatus Thiomargarita nelsonii TaxID=1003181 RepID=A0A176RTH8_9GAMM|nr:hypothetical protein THIOM_005354 [Candidatus Thiomargarita nelsonii]
MVGPVKIVSITPTSIQVGPDNRTINGAMLNPSPKKGSTQGYDSATFGRYGPQYDPKLNVAFNVSVGSPLELPAGSSLVSSISLDEAGHRPQLKTAAILTVLSEEPPQGSFRPPYSGSDKTIYHNKNELDYSKLKSLKRVKYSPSLSDVEKRFERPWLDHISTWTGRYIHPQENLPDYGREIAKAISDGALSLMLDYSHAEKETLLIRFVQLGIDLYGIAKDGGEWPDMGGHMHGRKLPILMAGLLLNDANMLEIVDAKKHFIFQEDRQTWFVEQRDVGREVRQELPRDPRDTYLQEDVGQPEWGIHHTRQNDQDNRRWEATYRDIVGCSILGHVLAARLLGAESLWNWPPLFAYVDRFWEIEKDRTQGGTNEISLFTRELWLEWEKNVK